MTYPPQQGPSPYGQQPPQQPYPPQPGYGYPQQQQPYPPQQQYPQQPYPPQQYPQQQGGYPGHMAPQGPPPPPQAPKNMSVIRNLVIIVLLLGALGGLKFGWDKVFESDAKAAAVGDCMKNNGTEFTPDMEAVDCGNSAAQFKIAEVHDDTADMNLCDKTKYTAYTETSGRRKSRTSVVLCLTDLKAN